MIIDNRFQIIKLLGKGSFSTIYSAIDLNNNQKVALKVEKPDKSKRILIFEYETLLQLQGLPNICEVYELIERNDNQNEKAEINVDFKFSNKNTCDQNMEESQIINDNQSFIVMKLLGRNLEKIKNEQGSTLTLDLVIAILVQMLDGIESVHSKGFIHRDIKPSNFVIGKGEINSKVFIIDLGLAKKHLQNNVPISRRKHQDFRGTITYASLNAHLKKDLSRRDDLWSFYFVILDFLNVNLPWKAIQDKEEVAEIKTKSLKNPQKYFWDDQYVSKIQQLKLIFFHIQNLKYDSVPNYQLIRMLLLDIRTNYLKNKKPQIFSFLKQPDQIKNQLLIISNQLLNNQNQDIIKNQQNEKKKNDINNGKNNGMKNQIQELKDMVRNDMSTSRAVIENLELVYQNLMNQENEKQIQQEQNLKNQENLNLIERDLFDKTQQLQKQKYWMFQEDAQNNIAQNYLQKKLQYSLVQKDQGQTQLKSIQNNTNFDSISYPIFNKSLNNQENMNMELGNQNFFDINQQIQPKFNTNGNYSDSLKVNGVCSDIIIKSEKQPFKTNLIFLEGNNIKIEKPSLDDVNKEFKLINSLMLKNQEQNEEKKRDDLLQNMVGIWQTRNSNIQTIHYLEELLKIEQKNVDNADGENQRLIIENMLQKQMIFLQLSNQILNDLFILMVSNDLHNTNTV